MRTKYRNGGQWPPDNYDVISSLNRSQPQPQRDPILDRLAANQLASDRAGMVSGLSDLEYANVVENKPYPDSWTGQASVDSNPYILDLMGIGEAAKLGKAGYNALKSLATKGALTAATRGGVEALDALRKKSISDFSESMANKRNLSMLDAQQKKIAEDRLQYISDRLLNEAATEDIVSNLDLQAQLTDVLESAIKGERDRVDEILTGIVKEGEVKRAAKDEINALAELLSGRSGGQSGTIMDPNVGILGKYSMSPYLAHGEEKFAEKLGRRVCGMPRLPYDITRPASRNEFGGRINVVKGR